MSKQRRITRRRFMQASAAGAAAGAFFPYIVPSHVLAQGGRPGANDRVTLAYIGTGGRGMSHVGDGVKRDDPVAAICDVDQKRIATALRAVQRVGQNPYTTQDYRRVLERKDVDAVMVATPDHWHALMLVHACQAGKDVYSEKPTCRTIQEGQAMINATRRYNRVVQIGSQGRSFPAARAAAQYVRNDQVGTVDHVDVWHGRNRRGGMMPDTDPPANLDWDLWLGPLRWRPYNANIHPGAFRWLMDIGGGFIRDRGNHVLSVVYWAMNADKGGPASVEATGVQDARGIWDTPVTMDVKWEFKNPDWTMTWSQPGRQRQMQGEQRIVDWGAELFGNKGSLIIYHGDYTDTEKKAKAYTPPAGRELPASPGHRENWLQCVKTRQDPIMPVEAGVAVITLPIIANISFLLGRRLLWDHAKQRFIGDDEANRYLGDPYRYPWHL